MNKPPETAKLSKSDKKANRLYPIYFLDPNPSHLLGTQVVEVMNAEGYPAYIGEFHTIKLPDGELLPVIETPLTGSVVFVIGYCQGSDAILEHSLLLDAAKRSGARLVISVLPYFPYSRQDRRSGQEPLSGALMARFLGMAGAQAVVTIDLHNPTLEGCFTIPLINISPAPFFRMAWMEAIPDLEQIVLGGPDLTASKRAMALADQMGVDLVSMTKQRLGPEKTRLWGFSGDVSGKRVMLIDDIVSTGSTLQQAAQYLLETGHAQEVFASVTHAVIPRNLQGLLAEGSIRLLFTSNSLPFPNDLPDQIKTVSLANPVARALIEIIQRNYPGCPEWS